MRSAAESPTSSDFYRVVVAVLVVALGLGPACSYESAYVAPRDGRARVVWKDNAPMVELAGSPYNDSCGIELQALSGYQTMTTTEGSITFNDASRDLTAPVYRGGFWVPRYYGPAIVVVHAGLAPRLFAPPLFLPRLSPSMTIARAGFGGGSGGFGGFRGGSASGKGLGYLLIAALVVAVTVLPAVDIGFAASSPQSAGTASRAIDLVNLYNDLVRSERSACGGWLTMQGGQP
jgi:hypothetical protein